MPYKLVIFDFDGTLADSAGWMLEIMNTLARRHHFREVTVEEIDMLRGLDNREVLDYLGVPRWRLPWIAHDVRRLNAASASRIPLFDGIERLLTQLTTAGITCAVVSSNGEATIRRVLGPSAALIAHYRCGVSIFGKAAKLRNLVRRLGVARHEVLCVGDETRDILAARAAGLDIAAVTWGYAKPEALRKCQPTLVVNSIGDLAEAICSPTDRAETAS